MAHVVVCGSNAVRPLNQEHGIDLVAAGLTNLASTSIIDASTMIYISAPIRWIKCRALSVAAPVEARMVALPQ